MSKLKNPNECYYKWAEMILITFPPGAAWRAGDSCRGSSVRVRRRSVQGPLAQEPVHRSLILLTLALAVRPFEGLARHRPQVLPGELQHVARGLCVLLLAVLLPPAPVLSSVAVTGLLYVIIVSWFGRGALIFVGVRVRCEPRVLDWGFGLNLRLITPGAVWDTTLVRLYNTFVLRLLPLCLQLARPRVVFCWHPKTD